MVDKDRVKGAAKDAAGTVQKEVGKLTGNDSMVAKGNANKAEGKLDKAAGHVKEAIRGEK
ncbi:CsbD family protein [Azospirillum sp. RWY-5-1]|uniref:CsbD family protein n=1 Tax=Azospirillum oleiclasticum TaxID=2735135 RepID=A0ABX2TAB4_9PROT|nr:CsbD family protein [Azospirillum oleiclasticum]NYZ15388.1 CsbD family protein [Azospirillum oleiclasticum]NYZ21193.1 CsbD family protein [Azospirillum oleiclasticum]